MHIYIHFSIYASVDPDRFEFLTIVNESAITWLFHQFHFSSICFLLVIYFHLDNLKECHLGAGEISLAVKSMCCSCRGWRFGSKHSYGGSQHTHVQFQRLLCFFLHQPAHMWCTYTCRQDTNTHKVTVNCSYKANQKPIKNASSSTVAPWPSLPLVNTRDCWLVSLKLGVIIKWTPRKTELSEEEHSLESLWLPSTCTQASHNCWPPRFQGHGHFCHIPPCLLKPNCNHTHSAVSPVPPWFWYSPHVLLPFHTVLPVCFCASFLFSLCRWLAPEDWSDAQFSLTPFIWHNTWQACTHSKPLLGDLRIGHCAWKWNRIGLTP